MEWKVAPPRSWRSWLVSRVKARLADTDFLAVASSRKSAWSRGLRELAEIVRKIPNQVPFEEPAAGAGAACVGPEPLSHPNLRVPWSRLLLRPVVITDDSRWFYRSATELTYTVHLLERA
ncbi:hypothetical protein RI054_01g04540 [Pseudoscourfieldia marina]